MIIGEAPGEHEEEQQRPFVGPSGNELSRMLHEAGILETECFFTNWLRFRPPANNLEHFLTRKKILGVKNGWEYCDGLWLSPTAQEHLEHLDTEIKTIQPNLIVPLGNAALWAVAKVWGITDRRGFVGLANNKRKYLPSYHPAYVLRDWASRPIVVHDLRRAKRESASPDLFEVPHNFTLHPTFTQACCWLTGLLERLDRGEQTELATDIETRQKQIACIGLAVSATEAICIPFLCVERVEGYWSLEEEVHLIGLLHRVLTHPNLIAFGQNFLYDNQYIAKQWGFVVPIALDTMYQQHVLFPALEKNLGFLATMYCEHPRYWKGHGKEWNPKTDSEDELWKYCCEDCTNTFEIAKEMQPLPARMKLEYPARLQHRLVRPLLEMMLRGIAQDRIAKRTLSRELKQAMQELLDQIETVLGHKLNPRSNKQMQALFYQDFAQRVIHKRKTGRPTLDDDALERIAVREPILKPLITRINNYRSLSTFKSTFAEAQLDTDGRLRCSWNPARVKTYRLSSSEDAFGSGGNLQNIPEAKAAAIARLAATLGPQPAEAFVGTLADTLDKVLEIAHDAAEKGYIRLSHSGDSTTVSCILPVPNIRSLFLPDPGMSIGDFDLDRADLQVVVWEANDAELKQMLREGVDVHAENAKVVGFPRQMAKVFVHGTNYGGGSKTMAANCGITVHTAEQAQKRWFGAHPGIKRWHTTVDDALLRTGTVSNAFGYRYTYFDRHEGLLPKCLAWIPQSTVAIVINHGLLAVWERMSPTVQVLMQVHDSLVCQFPTSQAPQIVPAICQNLLIPVPYPDPLTIPVSAKVSDKCWGDVKAWKG